MQDDARAVEERPAGRSRSHAAEGPERKPLHGRSEPNGSETPSVNVELPGTPAPGVPKDLIREKGSLPPDIPEVPKELQGPSKPPAPGPGEKGSGSAAPPDFSPDGPSIEMGRGDRRHFAMTVSAPTDSGVAFVPKGDSQYVAAIVLNRSLTGGINDGENDGDQGLLVVVEPRDSRGRPIDAPAKIVVALLDPAVLDEEGNASRLALWEFSAEETASMFRRVGTSEAIHLAMAWPDEPPKNSKLHLFVRYLTSDGRMLEADHPIEVAISGDKTARSNHGDRPNFRVSENGTVPLAESPEDRAPPVESYSPIQPEERKSERSPHTASRARESGPQRPVWSPERR
jgi:hypothetical protein